VIPCALCNKALEDPAASICGGIMGDEYIESWYFCASCGVYTKETYHDRFCGEPTVLTSRPLAKTHGDAQVALIRSCSRTWDKRCRCPSHMTYFDGHLD
jgi:hypothetical protein